MANKVLHRIRIIMQYAAVVFVSMAITLFMITKPKKSFSKGKAISFQLPNSAEKKTIEKAANVAFDLYEKYCSDFDEVSPLNKECRNTFGFYSTAVESMETLYLLGMKDSYNKAKKIVSKNLLPQNIGWVDRSEFWSRCIGSLIGTYLITGDQMFIDRAVLFADKLLSFTSKNPKYPTFVNFKLSQASQMKWRNDTVSMSDITAGLPELFALANITGLNKYLSLATQIVNAIPTADDSIHSYVNSKTNEYLIKEPAIFTMDGHTIPVYHALATSYLLKPQDSIKNKLSLLQNAFSEKISVHASADLLEVQRLMEKSELKLDLGSMKGLFYHAYEKLDLFGEINRRTLMTFNFDSQPMRTLLHTDQKQFETSYLESFEEFNFKNIGFSGKMYTSNKKWIPSGIQDSSFLGEWLKLGAEYLLYDNYQISNAIVNSHGHFLKLGIE